MVGLYRVEVMLRANGSAVFYLARHTGADKSYMLKFLLPELAQQSAFVGRFKRESMMLARLQHGNIVNIVDFGVSDGRLYIAMEYLDGGTLEEWFEKHRRPGSGAPPPEVHRMIAQVLQGLAHVHKVGLVHRDLKPANIMLKKTGEAKISDFFLARIAPDEEYRHTGGASSPFKGDSVTTTGPIVGTIDFMSPEVRNMQLSDARSDIYAMGVMTYYLLTGKKPYGLARPVSKLVPGLDLRWDEFIRSCLAEDKTQRYQSAESALDALQRVEGKSGIMHHLWRAVFGH